MPISVLQFLPSSSSFSFVLLQQLLELEGELVRVKRKKLFRIH
ncbi:Protein CBG27164 [Caenorhabditis briggsae]|uniref:Protein CBG27164 n=1 Tax=Caenorhabditis briggsae TaxID=6238 RepID=B6IL73_CAEBR|nr:Protein CBG27164 [Caenorhabditis briggsae]CAS00626.1 Protein CBG27164 [Caenorhabditis briggsae]